MNYISGNTDHNFSNITLCYEKLSKFHLYDHSVTDGYNFTQCVALFLLKLPKFSLGNIFQK